MINVKSVIKRISNKLGIEVTSMKNVPTHTFIGLRKLSIKTIIDVGANEGQFAKKILKIFPDATVHCFEPLPEQFTILKKWSDSFEKQSKVVTYNIALGDISGETEINYHTKQSASSSLLETTEKAEELFSRYSQDFSFSPESQKKIKIKINRLDEVFKEDSSNIEKDLLIKLDVQGFEEKVIKGGLLTFSLASACIVEIGITPIYKEQSSFINIVNLLNELGFKYIGNLNQSYSQNGSCIYLDAVFIKKEINDLSDFL